MWCVFDARLSGVDLVGRRGDEQKNFEISKLQNRPDGGKWPSCPERLVSSRARSRNPLQALDETPEAQETRILLLQTSRTTKTNCELKSYHILIASSVSYYLLPQYLQYLPIWIWT
jgi:hypothetical protein